MKPRSRPYIDLTGRLIDLKSSLSPDCKHFEPAPPLWQVADRPHPARTFRALTLATLLLWAALLAFYLWF